MNQMVYKVKDMFQYHIDLNDRLYAQLNTDPITGLANRQSFDNYFSVFNIRTCCRIGAVDVSAGGRFTID